jgi:hypothetical protein
VKSVKICGSLLPPLAVLCLITLTASANAAPPASPAFANKKPHVVERKIFDPDHPPAAMPPLEEHEQALCVASSLIGANFDSETLSRKKTPTGFEAAVQVTSLSATISMTITLWIPKDAPQFLKDHEEGHRQIVEQVYATAEKAALAAAKNVSGKTFSGTGKTAALAERDALEQARKMIVDDYTEHACHVWSRVNDIYDDLTDHAKNSAPTNEHPIEVKSAITQAFKQFTEEQAAKEAPATQPATAPATKQNP